MTRCNKCNVEIITDTNTCPLCSCPVINTGGNNVYPLIENTYKHHHLLIKLLLFCSLIAVFVCFFINFAISKKISWAWFVSAGIASFWITLMTALRGRKHFMRMLFGEMMVIIFISIAWDYMTGFRMWSINYCLPFLCSIYMISILIMRLFRKKLAKDFIFYATINSLIGLIPGVLILFNKVNVLWPSYISVILSIVILVFLLVFNKRQVANELERSFHI